MKDLVDSLNEYANDVNIAPHISVMLTNAATTITNLRAKLRQSSDDAVAATDGLIDSLNIMKKRADESQAWIEQITAAWLKLDDQKDRGRYIVQGAQWDHFAYLIRKPTPQDAEFLKAASDGNKA